VAAIPRRLTAEIESAHTSRLEVHAGDTITVEATILPWHGERRNVRIPVKLPLNLPEGPVRLLVSDSSTLDRLMQPPQFNAQPLDVAATIAQMNAAHTSDQLYVTLLAPQPQIAVDGECAGAAEGEQGDGAEWRVGGTDGVDAHGHGPQRATGGDAAGRGSVAGRGRKCCSVADKGPVKADKIGRVLGFAGSECIGFSEA
jgi:hypothetical protein